MSDGLDPARGPYRPSPKLDDIDADNPKRALVLELAQPLRTQEDMPLSLLLVEGQWRVVDFVPFLRELHEVPEGKPVPHVRRETLESLYRTTKVTGRVIACERSLDALAAELYEGVRAAEQKAAAERERAIAHHEGLLNTLKRADMVLAKGNGK